MGWGGIPGRRRRTESPASKILAEPAQEGCGVNCVAFKALPVTHKPSVSILLVLVEIQFTVTGKGCSEPATLRVLGQQWRGELQHKRESRPQGWEPGHRCRIDLETIDFLPPEIRRKSWGRHKVQPESQVVGPEHPMQTVGWGPCEHQSHPCSTGGAGEGPAGPSSKFLKEGTMLKRVSKSRLQIGPCLGRREEWLK